VLSPPFVTAIISFNDGLNGLTEVFNLIGMSTGYYTSKLTKSIDKSRISLSVKKSDETIMKRRKQLRAQRKGFTDKHNDEEGDVYVSGAF